MRTTFRLLRATTTIARILNLLNLFKSHIAKVNSTTVGVLRNRTIYSVTMEALNLRIQGGPFTKIPLFINHLDNSFQLKSFYFYLFSTELNRDKFEYIKNCMTAIRKTLLIQKL
ncbi:hypothetical protein BpHYR1_042759 [Brachionus plicatilis]|uniref:Uncharacterized protein n=1 Tax=Brachionus plicatilis TaxID=10195 RepID=A0A3M7R7K0_BRAPC|nr:hypothetical protein BpHYR1_042759 [Brachionus plicatilis]